MHSRGGEPAAVPPRIARIGFLGRTAKNRAIETPVQRKRALAEARAHLSATNRPWTRAVGP